MTQKRAIKITDVQTPVAISDDGLHVVLVLVAADGSTSPLAFPVSMLAHLSAVFESAAQTIHARLRASGNTDAEAMPGRIAKVNELTLGKAEEAAGTLMHVTTVGGFGATYDLPDDLLRQLYNGLHAMFGASSGKRH